MKNKEAEEEKRIGRNVTCSVFNIHVATQSLDAAWLEQTSSEWRPAEQLLTSSQFQLLHSISRCAKEFYATRLQENYFYEYTDVTSVK
jgi:hypothetical protein